MSTKDTISKDGKVLEALMGGVFKVELDPETPESEKIEILAALAGKVRKNRIRVLPGDRVKVEFSPHDMSRGRISYRYR